MAALVTKCITGNSQGNAVLAVNITAKGVLPPCIANKAEHINCKSGCVAQVAKH